MPDRRKINSPLCNASISVPYLGLFLDGKGRSLSPINRNAYLAKRFLTSAEHPITMKLEAHLEILCV